MIVYLDTSRVLMLYILLPHAKKAAGEKVTGGCWDARL